MSDEFYRFEKEPPGLRLLIQGTLNGHGAIIVQRSAGPWTNPREEDKKPYWDYRPAARINYRKPDLKDPNGASIEGDWFGDLEELRRYARVMQIVESLLGGADPEVVAWAREVELWDWREGEEPRKVALARESS